MEQLLTVRQVAELLQVSEDLIYRATRKREGLRGLKVGGVIRFKPSDVEAYLAAQEIKPPEHQSPFPDMERFTYRPGMKVVSL